MAVPSSDQPEASSSRHRLDDDLLSSAGKLSPRSRAREVDVDSEQEDETDRQAFLKRAGEYKRLHASVQTSTTLLDSLSSFLSTFQHDLSDVSNQIYELQDQSKAIDSRLEARRSVAQPINDIISDIILPPPLVATIRDTAPGDAWLPAIKQLHEKLVAVRARGNVKSAHEIGMVVEGLKAKAVSSLRTFLLGLIKPIRSSVRTNIQVVQSSILLKYQPFYLFLRIHAPKVAQEVQRSYVTSARTYYETSFRRYARALGVIKLRSIEKPDLIGVISSSDAALAAANRGDKMPKWQAELYLRLRHARITGDPVTLAYMEDDKDFRQPVEALFRSLLIVLLDNASAEFTFIVRFFSKDVSSAGSFSSSHPSSSESTLSSPQHQIPRQNSMNSLTSFSKQDDVDLGKMDSVSEAGDAWDTRVHPGRTVPNGPRMAGRGHLSKEETGQLETLWKHAMGSALEYCQTFFQSVIEPLAPPPAIPLLTMIRLNDDVLAEIEERGCIPLESVCTSLKLSMWPIFRKEMDAHLDSMKKLADAAAGTGFGAMLSKGVKDSVVREVCIRYGSLYSCVTALSNEAEEAMLFSSMSRLRTELLRLIANQSNKIKQPQQQASFLSAIYEDIIQVLVAGPGKTTQPVLQSEISFFRAREEEARRRIRASD